MKNKFNWTLRNNILLMLMFVLLLAGCSDKEGKTAKGTGLTEDARYEIDVETPAWKLDTKENTELTWYVNADWFNTDYGNDPITKTIKGDLKLDIKFLTGGDEKLNTHFAGGNIPDIITIFDGNSAIAKKADTWALSLNDLADKYDPYFYKVASEQTVDWFQLKDGKTYGYPSFSNTEEDYNNGMIHGNDGFIIREDIYKAIGEPDFSTPEGMLSAFESIKKQFPNVTPFGFKGFSTDGDAGSLGDTLQNYLGVPIETADGKWKNRNLDENYLKWVAAFNEAFKKGYISEDNFTQDNTVFEENVASGKYGAVLTGGIAQLSGYLQKNIEANPAQRYIAIDGPNAGNEPTLAQAGLSGWTVTYISKDVKDPQKAIQLFTYLLSEEGQYLTTFGIEGETYEINEEGKAVFLPEVLALSKENPEDYKKKYRMGEFWFFGHDRFGLEKGVYEPLESISQIRDWGKGYLKPQFIIENVDPDHGTPEARSLVNIKSRWATTLANLLSAKDSAGFDKVLQDYQKFLDDNKFEAITEIRSQKMNENKEKLGIN